jgi:ribonuclease-3
MALNSYPELADKVRARFAESATLRQAFTHRSWLNENPGDEARGNPAAGERLEFLGDAVLGLIIAHYLFTHHPDKDEGWLSKAKARIVSSPALAVKAEILELDKLLRLGKGEKKSGSEKRPALLADTFEALLGAWFLEYGLQETVEFLLRIFASDLDAMQSEQVLSDAKTMLQEYTQKKLGLLPDYEETSQTGPDHARVYHVQVKLAGTTWGMGSGRSRKNAEQNAAMDALKKINKNDEEGRLA